MKRNLDKHTVKGLVASSVGIACNLLLSAAKIAVGVVLGMISVVADGFNNLGDCCSGIVALVSVRIASKPADKLHPYGHRRAEYIAAMVTGFLVLIVAVELLKESVFSVIDGKLDAVNWIVYFVLGASVVVKAAMFAYYRVTAKQICSDSLKAAATDSLCDCIATLAVVVGAVLAEFGIAADGWVSIAVALFVGWQGVKLVREASSKLLGQAPDAKQVNRIKELIRSFDGVLGMHDLHVFTYGNGIAYATVHVEMDSELSSMQSHAILDELEQAVYRAEKVCLTAHLDPVDTHDEQAAQLEKTLCAALEKRIVGVEIHDFRIIRGAVDKLVFDVGVPYGCTLPDGEIEKQTVAVVKNLGDYDVDVTVERGVDADTVD